MVSWSMHVCLFHCNFDHPKLLELTNKVSIMFGKQTILFPLKESKRIRSHCPWKEYIAMSLMTYAL